MYIEMPRPSFNTSLISEALSLPDGSRCGRRWSELPAVASGMRRVYLWPVGILRRVRQTQRLRGEAESHRVEQRRVVARHVERGEIRHPGRNLQPPRLGPRLAKRREQSLRDRTHLEVLPRARAEAKVSGEPGRPAEARAHSKFDKNSAIFGQSNGYHHCCNREISPQLSPPALN